MNRDANGYTIVYASVMVILVAVILAFTSQSLKERQLKNAEIDKMMQILRSIRVDATAADAEAEYNKLIKQSFLVDQNGQVVDGDAFAANVKMAMEKHTGMPVFVAEINGETKYILALHGAGLWGPIWGYISLDADKNTVYGTDFGHQGETPGLGAEIAKPAFSKEFYGKKIFGNDGEFKSIAIVKPGKTAEGQDYVDGISGGTITSQGVDKMLYTSLKDYVGFLKSKNQ